MMLTKTTHSTLQDAVLAASERDDHRAVCGNWVVMRQQDDMRIYEAGRPHLALTRKDDVWCVTDASIDTPSGAVTLLNVALSHVKSPHRLTTSYPTQFMKI